MDQAWDMAMSSVLALSIGGISAVLGLWVGRDKRRPVYFAVLMTALILSAVGVGVVQSVLDAEDAIKKEQDLDRMVETVTEIAIASGDEELAKLIESQTGVAIEIPDDVADAADGEDAAGDTGAADEEGADTAEGDAAEGDATEGDAAEGDAAEGDAADGDAAEGDAAEADTPPDGAAAPATE